MKAGSWSWRTICIVLYLLLRGVEGTLRLRWCVEDLGEYHKCGVLARALTSVQEGVSWRCTLAGSGESCLAAVMEGTAHAMVANPRGAYEGATMYGLKVLAAEMFAEKLLSQSVTAVVRANVCKQVRGARSARTRKEVGSVVGRKVCLGPYKDPVGWEVPLGVLMKGRSTVVSENATCIPGDLEMAARIFNETQCVQGSGQGELQNLPCSSTATGNSKVSVLVGDAKRLQCLRDGAGDVAFVTKGAEQRHVAVAGHALPLSGLRILCADGTCAALNSSCSWGQVPGNAVLAGPALGPFLENSTRAALVRVSVSHEAFRITFFSPSNEGDTLFSRSTVQLAPVTASPFSWLSSPLLRTMGAMDSLRLPCQDRKATAAVRWCTVSPAEYAKCRTDLQPLLRQASPAPLWACVEAASVEECLQAARNGSVDVLSLDAISAVQAAHVAGMVPIAAEAKGPSPDLPEGVVAVVHRAHCHRNLTLQGELQVADLRGSTACLGGYNSTAGWDVPLVALADLGLLNPVDLDPDVANDIEAMATFFGQQCAPTRTPTPLLCSSCQGECRPAPAGMFSEDDGALRCLQLAGGDVAFVRASSLAGLTGRRDLQLLSPRGGCKDLVHAPSVAWGAVGSRVVLIRRSLPASISSAAVSALAKISSLPSFRRAFGTASNPSSLLFNARTTRLLLFPLPSTRGARKPATGHPAAPPDAWMGADVDAILGRRSVVLYEGSARMRGPALEGALSVRWILRRQKDWVRDFAAWVRIVVTVAAFCASGFLIGSWALEYLRARHRQGLHRHACNYTKEMMDDF